MSAATMEVLHGEGGDDRQRAIELAKLHEMFDAEAVPEPELRPAPGEFAPVAVGNLGRMTTRRVIAMPDRGRRNVLGPEVYIG